MGLAVGVSLGITVSVAVRVGGASVGVGDGVSVGGSGVSVGKGVSVGGSMVAVGGIDGIVGVGGTCVGAEHPISKSTTQSQTIHRTCLRLELTILTFHNQGCIRIFSWIAGQNDYWPLCELLNSANAVRKPV